MKKYLTGLARSFFIYFLFQYFNDSHKTEQKLVKLVNELNTTYDVQNISSKPEAEKAMQGLMVCLTNKATACTTLLIRGVIT